MVPDPEVGDSDQGESDAIIPEQPREGSAEPGFPPDGRTGDVRGNYAWSGSWIVQLPQGDPDS
jgi:hypothetical protein